MNQKVYRHIDDVDVTAQFAQEQNVQLRYRLEITRKRVNPPGRTVCAVMQNPSYAGKDFADKSVQFLENVVFQVKGTFSEFDGVRKLIIVNQFAAIQTNDFIGAKNEIGLLNDEIIKAALNESDIVLIAWGTSNLYKDRQDFVYSLLASMPNKKVLRTSSHPSRGHYKGFILPEGA